MRAWFDNGDFPFQGKEQRVNRYVKFVDLILFTALLAGPFSTAFLDRETGEGAFVAYIYILFVVLAMPVWKAYFYRWHWGIGFYFLFLGVGFTVDVFTNEVYSPFYLFVLIRQATLGIIVGLAVYNMVLRDSKNIKRILLILAVCSLITSVFMMLGWGVKESSEHMAEGMRYAVLGQNANATGRVMVLGIIILGMIALRALNAGLVWRIISWCGLPLLFYSLLRTSSRGSLATFFASMPFIMFTAKTMTSRMKYFFVGLLALALAIAALLSSEMMMSRISKAIYDRDTGGREVIWEATMSVWKDHPFLGGGMVTHAEKSAGKLGVFFYERKGGHISSHNTYLRALAGGGIVGAAFYLLTLMHVGWRAWRWRKMPYANVMFVLFVCFLFSGLTINIEHAKYLYIIWGLILGFDHQAKRYRIRLR